LTVDSGSEKRTLSFFWVVGTAEQVAADQEVDQPAEAEESTPAATETPAATAPPAEPPAPPSPPPRKRIHYEDLEDGIAQLPPLARSLLKIRVPVKVTLAETKIPVRRVLDIGPGSILQFDKSCEAPLTLEAGDQAIAVGEAVKVGDKFGLWITTIAMPDERFWVLRGNASQRVK
jgi:flagellar motor switch/type III secretory pathway protein FliN